MQTHTTSAGDLTTAQACEILGIDRATLTRWVEKETIRPSFKFPGRTGGFLFRRADIQALAEHRAGGQA